MHAGLHLRALLPAGGAAEICKRSQNLRRQQRLEASQRAPPPPARRRRELARLRGGGASPRPRLRLRWRHLLPPEAGGPPPEGARCRQCRPYPVRLQRDPALHCPSRRRPDDGAAAATGGGV